MRFPKMDAGPAFGVGDGNKLPSPIPYLALYGVLRMWATGAPEPHDGVGHFAARVLIGTSRLQMPGTGQER